jgi:hypothetical protein
MLPRVLQGIVSKARGWSITSLSWRLVCDSIHRLCVTGIWLGYRPGSLGRIFTGSYSLPPSLVAIWSFRIPSSHAAWCCLMKSVAVFFQHHHVLSGASCVFIHPSSRGFVLVLSFWISSCMYCWTVASSSVYWHHVHLLHLVVIALLLTLLRGFTPASRTGHIHSSIKDFIKLPFQWVLIRLDRSSNEGAMVVSLQHCLLSRISACATIGDLAISACRNFRLPCRLIRWNVDFIELLKI